MIARARVVAAVALGCMAGPALAQEAPVFGLLDGAWIGEGELLGRPAAFEMRWDLRPGDVAVLTFANAFRDPAGARTPVLDASAVYRTSTATPDAHWADSRGVSIRIRWEAAESTLVSHWEAPDERGRTEYVVTDTGVEVTDRVESGGEWRVFATATYRRAVGELPGPHPALEPLGWLAGCWRRGGEAAVQEERWSRAAGEVMVGTNHTVRDGRLTAFEYLRIQVVDGVPNYVAVPSDQAETAFPLIAVDDTSMVFENLDHDFPQRIGYALSGSDRLNGWIEGPSDAGVRRVPFPFVRVRCEG